MADVRPLAAALCRPQLAMSGLVGAAWARAGVSLLDLGARAFSTSNLASNSTPSSSSPTGSLFVSDVSMGGHRAPLLLGLMNQFLRHVPSVGFFEPISAQSLPKSSFDLGVDKHVELLYQVYGLKGDPHHMSGIRDIEAAKLIATGKQSELLDRIYSAYHNYKDTKNFVLVEGPGPIMGDTELDASIAATLNSPVLMSITGKPRMTANEYFNLAVLKRQVFQDHKVDVTGVVLNQVPYNDHSALVGTLRERFKQVGLQLLGGIPQDPMLGAIRLDEVKAQLAAEAVWGDVTLLDQEFDDVVVASQRLEELLEQLAAGPKTRHLIVTSLDRMDIVLGLLAAQLSVTGPTVAGVLMCQAGVNRTSTRNYAKATMDKIFNGAQKGGMYRGTLMPVLALDEPLYDVVQRLSRMAPSILPTSSKKIQQCKALFDKHIDAAALNTSIAAARTALLTPKMFTYSIKTKCLADPQHIVLPEGSEKRVLAAASEVTQRGLAKITLLGNKEVIESEAKKLGVDISLCKIVDPENSPFLDKYTAQLVEARKGKGMTTTSAQDVLTHDVNYFGTMMVAAGDADGMVSGSIHTTAATIRPGMQVLKNPGEKALVSSIFFMCLPDKVLCYGDCAVNVNPTADDLARIAISSADTAAAFGIEPRVAMLSYSTLGSGAGPDVQKVVEATAIVKKTRPDIKVEGPIQYDAAIDPAVAAVKVKSASEVAGKATVFIFPDLNTGNNTYKAVQQASGAIAMGPVMQGLQKPVNDLSRGCTIADIVNTICVTSIQAMQCKAKLKAAAATTPAPAAAAAK